MPINVRPGSLGDLIAGPRARVNDSTDMVNNTAELVGGVVKGTSRIVGHTLYHLFMLLVVLISLFTFWPLGLVLLCVWAFSSRKKPQNIVQQVIVVQQPLNKDNF